MNLEPIVLTRNERLLDEPVSRWRKVRHYGPQIARIAAKATVRWVRLFPRRAWRLIWAYWVLSLIVLSVAAFFGFTHWWKYIGRQDAIEKDTRYRSNQSAAQEYATKWKASFLGDSEAVCFDSVEMNQTYNVVCHIGVKGQVPTTGLKCTQVGCELFKL